MECANESCSAHAGFEVKMASGDKAVSLKRLNKEYHRLSKSPPTGISISLPSDADFYVWEALLDGPVDTVYKDGVFKARVCIPINYPVKAPEVHFVSPFPYHLNVSQTTGQVCLGLLGDDKWEPSFMSLEHVLQALVAILIRPEESNAMDHELLNDFHNYRWGYDANAKSSAVTAAKSFQV